MIGEHVLRATCVGMSGSINFATFEHTYVFNKCHRIYDSDFNKTNILLLVSSPNDFAVAEGGGRLRGHGPMEKMLVWGRKS